MASLDAIRKELDAIDREILNQLQLRQQAVYKVAENKMDGAEFLRDRAREEDLLTERLTWCRDLGLDPFYVTCIFREILDHSLRLQQDYLMRVRIPEQMKGVISVGYQGTAGAYSHRAARLHFASRYHELALRGYTTFKEMAEALVKGQLHYAVLPIENTTAGSINEAYDLLNRLPLSIVGEEVISIHHCLVAIAKVPLAHIRRIYSHPVALAQCSDFLATLVNCHVESFSDTATAVKHVRESQDPSIAAIASEEAANLYNVRVIKRNVANVQENYTRFVILAREHVRYDPRIICKTSLILTTGHKEGALARCLNILVKHHLNLTKLESRPRPNMPWEYLFYIDFEGNVETPEVTTALSELSREAGSMKVLGSYPARTTESAQPAVPRTKDDSPSSQGDT